MTDEYIKARDAYFFDHSRRGVKEDFCEGANWAQFHSPIVLTLVAEADRILRNPIYTSQIAISAWDSALAAFNETKEKLK